MTGDDGPVNPLALVLALLAVLPLPGAGTAAPSAPAAAAVAAPVVHALPATGRFDYQLGGASTPPRGVTIVARDVTDRPAPGTYGICYINGFQTQPGDDAQWRRRPQALLRTASGRLVTDPDWPDEHVLDPSTAAQRRQILAVVGPQLRECARRGFRAVELDNLDTFTRFTDPRSGLVPRAGALALAREYVVLGHRLGLAVGQKNTAELGAAGRRQIGFDFAVAEECSAFRECGAYTAVYGSRVLQIEYPDSLDGTPFARVCASRDRASRTILRDRDLVPAGRPGHLYRSC